MLAVLAATALLAWIGVATLRAGFWRVRFAPPAPEPRTWPAVVAIVPARDEARLVTASLPSLLAQDYPGDFHVILVDDHSADGTGPLAIRVAQDRRLQHRLTVVAARQLPPGWTGKVWAQAEGMREQARRHNSAAYVFLTDADILHEPGSLRRLVARAEAGRHVLVSEMVRLRCASLPEMLLVPAFVFFFAMLYPFAKVNDPRSKVAAAAGGCMLVRTDALASTGGIAAIRGELIDDCALAARMKRQGPIRLDLSQSRRSLRPCDGWPALWNMIARSAYTQLHHSPLLLAATIAGMLWLYVLPPVLAFTTAAWYALPAWLIMAGLYVPMLACYGRSPLWALTLPLVALFYLGATIASGIRYYRGTGGMWKGRAQAPVT